MTFQISLGNIEAGNEKKALYITNDGNCCWSLYESQKFFGKLKKLAVGQDWYPEFTPRSVKKHDC
jgi:hypothetical protein